MAQVEVCSDITGTVVAVLIEVGASVEEEAELLVVESMKMEIPLLAPVEGTVTHIAVAKGEALKDGQLALVIERG